MYMLDLSDKNKSMTEAAQGRRAFEVAMAPAKGPNQSSARAEGTWATRPEAPQDCEHYWDHPARRTMAERIHNAQEGGEDVSCGEAQWTGP